LTHFHKDHVGAIRPLLERLPQVPVILTRNIIIQEFRALILAGAKNKYIKGTVLAQNIFRNIKRIGNKVQRVKEGDILYDKNNPCLKVIYPSDLIIDHYKSKYEKDFNKWVVQNEKKDLKLSSDFNHQIIVLELSTPKFDMLIGGDFVKWHNNSNGLEYVLNKLIDSAKKFQFYKVPHHGSHTGYSKLIIQILDSNVKKLITTAWFEDSICKL